MYTYNVNFKDGTEEAITDRNKVVEYLSYSTTFRERFFNRYSALVFLIVYITGLVVQTATGSWLFTFLFQFIALCVFEQPTKLLVASQKLRTLEEQYAKDV